MRRCVGCGDTLAGGWRCAGCGYQPEELDGVLCLAPESAKDGKGFDPDSFHHLVDVEEGSFWFQGRNQLILWALERYCPTAGSLLEVGCGTGYVLAGIRAKRPDMQLAGAELYVEGLAHARRRVPSADFYQLDATHIPFEEEWDVVCAFDVLEHVGDDQTFLAGLHAAARPGGRLLVTVPQHRWLWSRADDYAHHVRRYTRRELVDKVGGAGFRVERVTSFVTLLLPAMWASRLRDRRSRAAYDPTREHVSGAVAPILKRTLGAEVSLIKRGVDLPVGGSLLLVAARP